MKIVMPTPRALVIAGVAVLLVALAGFGGWYWYDAQQRRVAAAFAEVMTRVHAAQAPEAAPDQRARATRELEQLLAQYPSASPVAEAAYELGNLRYAGQQYAAARGAYDIALARSGSPTLRTLARASVGYTWEADRDFAKAADAYQALARDLNPKDFYYEQAMLDLGRAQELAGRKPDAIATYQKLLKEAPNSRRAEDVRLRLAGLGAPAPSAPPAAPTPAAAAPAK